MVGDGLMFLLVCLVMAAIRFMPILLVAKSRRAGGDERAPWLGYIGFVLSTRDRVDGQGLCNG